MEGPESTELPKGWQWTTIGDVCLQVIGGGTPSRAVREYFGGETVWLTPTEVPKDRVVELADSKTRITSKGLSKSSARMVPRGAVLLTSRASIGSVAIAGIDLTTNQGFASFVCSNRIYNLFLAYWLWSNKETLELTASGTTFLEISKKKLREMRIPLPPLDEQRLIVSKVESILERTRAAKQGLSRIPGLTKRLRMAILSKAFRGEPTEIKPEEQSAESLAEKALAEKKQRTRSVSRQNEEAVLWNIRAEFPYSVPETWTWVKLEDISVESGCGATPLRSEKKNFPSDGIPLIKVQNIVDNGAVVLTDDQLRISRAIHEGPQKRSRVRPGDILVNIVGPPLGKIGIVPSELKEANINQAIVFFRIHSGILSEYVWYALQSPVVNAALQSMGKGVRQENIRRSDVGQIVIPLAPRSEQSDVVRRIRELLPMTLGIDADAMSSRTRLASLEQALLSQAFQGGLS